MRTGSHQLVRARRILISFLFCLHLLGIGKGAWGQGWKQVGSAPFPPIAAKSAYEPTNASPFWRGWQKPVYDTLNKKLLLYLANPPCCGGTFSNALFFYDTNLNTWSLAWSHMTVVNTGGPADAESAPADRHPYHWMAWDSTRNVLWTGFGSGQVGGAAGECGDCAISDLYKFDPSHGQGVWTEICGKGMSACPPGVIQESAAAYDPSADVVVMYGGLQGGSPTADTWLYYPATNSWKKVCGERVKSCGTMPLNGHSMVSIGDGNIVMFGGKSGADGLQNATWTFNTSTKKWTRLNSKLSPPATKFPPMDYDPALGKVILIGNEQNGPSHVWALDPASREWTDLNVPPGPTIDPNVPKNSVGAFDVAANRFVLFTSKGYPDPGTIWTLSLPGPGQRNSPNVSIPPKGSPESSRPSPVAANVRNEGTATSLTDRALLESPTPGAAGLDPRPPTGIDRDSGSATRDRSDAGGSSQLNVPLIIQEAIYAGVSGIRRSEDPVTVGIPLPDSAGVNSVSQLGLNGASVGQFRVLGRWPSGNVKWILVDTQADVPAGGNNRSIALTAGSGNFGGTNLALDDGATITINTGAAKFTIKKANFNLIDVAVVDGRTLVSSGSSAGLVVVGPAPGDTTCPCSTIYSSSNDADSTAVIEENGPARTVVKATGQHKDSTGNAYMRYTVRMHFYKNRSHIKIVSQLQNADYGPSKSIVSAYKGFSAYEARLALSLGTQRSFSFGTVGSALKSSFNADENAYLYQAYSNKMEDCGWNAPDRRPQFAPRSYIARTQVVKASCKSVWSYAQEGYQIVQGTSTLARGSRTEYPAGWADLYDASGAGIEIGVYQMAGYWPKSLQFMNGGNEVRIGIWPDQSLFVTGGGQPYFQSWPQYSIHTLYLDFHSAALANPSNEFDKFQYNLIARAPRAQYSESGVLPFALMDSKQEDDYYKSLHMWCCIEDIPFPHVFRHYAWAAGGGGNQSEFRWANLMLWLQRGFTARYIDSANFYLFQTEQVFPRSDYKSSAAFHWRDASVPESDFDNGGSPSNIKSLNNNLGCDPGEAQCGRNWIDDQHAHWYGMIDYYFLTGDESIKDAIEAGASDKFGNPKVQYVQKGLYWAARNIGEALISDARLFRFLSAIGDSATAADALIAGDLTLQNQVWPDLQVSGFGTAPQGVSRTRGAAWGCCGTPRWAKPFQLGILNQGLWEYLQVQGTTWPKYQETFDLAYGIANFALSEGWRSGPFQDGCDGGTGLAYQILLDEPNNPLTASCDQTVWFNFYVAAKYTGDPNAWNGWKAKFPQQLKRLGGGHNYFDEYGTIIIGTMVDEILRPQVTTLVNVPVKVQDLGNGSASLSWTVPAGALSYRLKYSNKKIVEWLNFDPLENSFGLDPTTNVPWFAAPDINSAPAPGAPGSVQTFPITGLDPSKTWNFALKAYVNN
jgi:YetA-like protein/Galactose oxidase, central domain